MDRDDEDFGEGFVAESHPLRPTHLSVPINGRPDSRAPSISSSVSDMDVPIYARETTIPVSAGKVSRLFLYILKSFIEISLNCLCNKLLLDVLAFSYIFSWYSTNVFLSYVVLIYFLLLKLQ